MMIWMISEPWLLSRRAELRTAMSSTPAITPCRAPRPPKMRDAAEQHRGDHLELEADAGVGGHRVGRSIT